MRRSRQPVPEEAPIAARLGQAERRRRLWHMLPGLLPFALWPIPHRDPLSPTLQLIMAGVAVVVGGSIFVRYRQIQRTSEDRERLAAVAGYALSVLGALLLFPADPEIGLTVLAVLAFGDGSATLGGLLFRGPRLPWNNRKSWSGLFCFIAVGAPIATLVFWGESHNLEAEYPGVSLLTALLCAGGAVTAGAVAESIESPVNDNVRVGVTATAVLVVLHSLLVGGL